MDHQQFNYLDSRIIFFFDSDPKTSKLTQKKSDRSIQRGSLKNRNLSQGKQNARGTPQSENKVRKIPEEEEMRKDNNILVMYSQQRKQINCVNSDVYTNSSKINNVKQGSECMVGGEIYNNLNKQIANKNQQRKEKEIDNKNGSVIDKLEHHEIVGLFGEYHRLYQIQVDYLANEFGKRRKYSQQLSHILQKYAPSQNKPKPITKLENSTSVILHNETTKINQYVFQSDRAPIVPFIKDKTLKTTYEEKVKLNYRNCRYIDHQFSHENTKYINGEEVSWKYISPQPSLTIFPSSLNQHHEALPCDSQLPFVSFLKHLYQIQSSIFVRLLEPPINNVFSVWLFYGNIWQPVFVDGYFPCCRTWKQVFNGFGDCLWLPIFVKCICKIFGSYDTQLLRNVTDQQIYTLLYGQKLNIFPINQGNSSLNQIVELYKKRQKKCKALTYKKGSNFKLVFFEQRGKTRNTKKLQGNQQVQETNTSLIGGIILEIAEPRNWHIYSFSIPIRKPAVFSLNTPSNFKLVFPLFSKTIDPERRISIYKIATQQKLKTGKMALCCKINHLLTEHIRLSSGNYRILYDIVDRIQEKEFQAGGSGEECMAKMGITILSSIQVKISQGEGLLNTDADK